MSRILIIEDNKELADTVHDFLKRRNFAVDLVHDGAEGLYWLKHQELAAAIIDWELPNLSGINICTQYRNAGGKTPILMLTGHSAIEDRIEGLDAGADDYLSKPFDPLELWARLRALLRRAPNYQSEVIVSGDIELNTGTTRVKRCKNVVRLSKTEYTILEMLMKNPGRVFSSGDLIDRVWGADEEVTELTVRTHIARLRSKLVEAACGNPAPVKTVYGRGYIFETSEDQAM